MTDTGQIPGEGLPENAVGEAARRPHLDVPGNGVPQQPGWGAEAQAPLAPQPLPAHQGLPAQAAEQHGAVAYDYLDHPAAPGAAPLDDEDDVLLMPGPQGSWSDPQPVPAQRYDAPSVSDSVGPLPVPHQGGPEPVYAEQGATGQHVPAPGMPGGVLPEEAGAGQAFAGQAVPAQGAPGQSLPGRGAPAGGPAEQGYAGQGVTGPAGFGGGLPEQNGAGQAFAGQGVSGPGEPGGVLPEQAGAEPVYAGQGATGQHVPAPGMPGGGLPEEAGAGQAFTGPGSEGQDVHGPAGAAPSGGLAGQAFAASAQAGAEQGPPPGEVSEPVAAAGQGAAQPLGEPAVQPPVAPAPRRPLHMGPPIPDPSSGGVSVRSLADRGPAVRASGPATSGPEYLDVPSDDTAGIPAQQTGEPGNPAVPVPSSAWPAAGAAAPEVSQQSLIPHADSIIAPQHFPAAPQGEQATEGPQFAAPAGQEPSPGAGSPAPVAEAAAAPAAVPVREPAEPVQAQPGPEPVETAPVTAEPAAAPERTQPPVDAAPAAVAAAAPAAPAPAEESGTPAAGVAVTAAAVVGVPAETLVAAVAPEPAVAAPDETAPPVPAEAAVPPPALAVEDVAGSGNFVVRAPAEAIEPAVPGEPQPTPAEAETRLAAEAGKGRRRRAASAGEPDPSFTSGVDISTALEEEQGAPAEPYEPAVRDAVHRVMRERRDIRNGFRSDPIPHDVLLRVLEAAHTAPSVGHSQPWDFVVIRSEKTREKMHELAMHQRDAYAKSLPKARARQFRELKIEAILDTPVNIVVTADPTRGGRHTLGRHTQPQMAPYSSALAVENLWLAARAEGLGVGWVSFFDERQMVTELGLPEHLEVVAYLCVGYVDEFPDEPELMQAGWSKRRPLSWVVHEEEYGNRALPGEEPHDLLDETLRGIRPLDAKALGEAWERQKRMTKPAGALGMLEIISAQLSGLSRQCPPPIPEPAAVAIFAGDHGVHAQGVTAWPQEVTGQMVANFLGGGAVCNAFANQVGAEVCVIDVGVASELPSTPGLLPRKVRPGTADFTQGPAMSREEALRAIEVGIETARDLVSAGNKALLTGEMGIANTTASAVLISVFTGADPAEVTGRGTGINDEMHARKIEVVRRALELHRPDPADPIAVLAAVGGLEHAAMVGLLLGAAALRTPVILDGVSAGAAALVARAIAPEVLAACIAGHRSAEPGHVAALTTLGLRPLVDLDLRLGEGTGALLALPLVQSAARVMHEVATFDAAGVTEKS
ncbi:nicotinate-nucleotide--dimethylbenzimidazole phosphoribosyltransferase [Streptomyces sp. NBC_01476]|uniref:nicotinate-nucleotide--dimethylbenzimidazole phosphoribosyltransferase n=1 Tax=Streptomyces sp. NBC_01476 TaxID=2903881 RepID=UPI002E3342F5|nr:nicotinate-nucleotide--dimethylbenzimidazole phosphoribosyltransferase [Streptomyces sp. NBC_01476]